MKIAQFAPLHESVPPNYYGGTERVVSYLTEELVAMGHEVTLFASGDSVTSAKLEPTISGALRLKKKINNPLTYELLSLEHLLKNAYQFNIIHFHIDLLHFPIARSLRLPHITTLHGRLDIPDLLPFYREFNEMPVISISDSQRIPLPFANWQSTVYNGIPENLLSYNPQADKDYLAFLGRISPEKGIEQAIEIAIRADIKLKIAAKVDKADEEYYSARIKPLLKHPLVEYVGEISDAEKQEFLGNAYALIFPINWPEPFGLVMIEAMACGTPVIAFPRGSVREIMADDETGFVVESIEDAIDAIYKLDTIDRMQCRRIFEQRFTARRMARDYLAVYHSLVDLKLPLRVTI